MSAKNQPVLLERFRLLWNDEEVWQIVRWLRRQSAKLKAEAGIDYRWGDPIHCSVGDYKHRIGFGLGLIAEWIEELLRTEKEEQQ